MLTSKERDVIVAAIEAKECHLSGDHWWGANGRGADGTFP